MFVALLAMGAGAVLLTAAGTSYSSSMRVPLIATFGAAKDMRILHA